MEETSQNRGETPGSQVTTQLRTLALAERPSGAENANNAENAQIFTVNPRIASTGSLTPIPFLHTAIGTPFVSCIGTGRPSYVLDRISSSCYSCRYPPILVVN